MKNSSTRNACPIVNFTGPLKDESCINLIDHIRALRDELFFTEVQLRISSPGGQLSALKYFAESVHELQADGLKIATHAITTVASAAAVMLSLGDMRTAHRKSVLLYHTGRLLGVDGAITAKGAESMATALNTADDEIVSLLVARAVHAPVPKAATPVELFALGDWPVIRRLSPGNARKPKTLLRMFRKRITEAFKDPSTKLRKLYSDFCALDSPVSPYLALELGLIDGVGDGNPNTQELSAATDEDGLVVPEWESLYSGGWVPRPALTRHTMILGETGSGKTVSGVLPILSAIIREASPVSCALVIDPKSEIYAPARRFAGSDCSVRLIQAGVDSINIMGGSRSVAEEVSNGKWMTAAQKILGRSASFADSPARVFAGKRVSSGKNAYWENEGARLAQCVLALTLLISKEGRLTRLLSNAREMRRETRRQLIDFGTFAGLIGDVTEEATINVVAVANRALNNFFLRPGESSSLTAKNVIEVFRKEETADDEYDAVRKDVFYWDKLSATPNQYAGVLGEARCCLLPFADPAPAKSMFFGVERRKATIDFAPDIEVDTVSNGRVIYVYQPALGDDDALVAKGLKGAFFEAVLASPARRERGANMPLACYIADEFHRFITSDSAHGEQNFLDTCRSFGTACVLATQSEASIRHALALAGEPSYDTAIEILMTNTATKLVFRSTEAGVRNFVDSLCPGNGPDRVTAIRPPASLKPGECYASLPDGRFERRQLKQFEPPKKMIEPSTTCR